MAESRNRKGALDLQNLVKTTIPKAPSFDEFLKRSEVKGLIDAMAIVSKYRNNPDLIELDPETTAKDILHLSAINVNTAAVSAYVEGLSKTAEDNLKLARSKAWRDIKEAKKKLEEDGDVVQVTEKESEHLARLISEDSISTARDSIIVAEILKHGYFAIKDFILLADSILKRASSEKFNVGKM